MRIVQAFKANGHIVAMTGDGVNDAPALKNADIGIAMGKRGSEVSREAADLILMDDNFSTIVNTVRDARRIYDNIRKASCYVFTIHVPIALAAFIAPLLHIAPSNLLFLPVHVVLLEFIIDPTCSIVFERQPAERDLMAHPPRHPDTPILSAIMIWRSILQGVALFLASFGLYYVTLTRTGNAAEARSIALATLLVANLLLVYVNSSERDSILTTFRRLMHDRAIWAVNLCICAGLLTFLFSPLGKFLKLAPLTLTEGIYAVFFAACAVLWVELLKWRRRSHAR
jgi:Ca2+-transporting ATPase